VPLLMFGGPVKRGIDNRWNSHVSIGKTVLDLLGLPPLGVPRLDNAPSLADLVDTAATPAPPPAAYGSTITQPAPPTPAPTPPPPLAAPAGPSAPVAPVLLREGTSLPPPNDQPVT
jgi:hypothetical protein